MENLVEALRALLLDVRPSSQLENLKLYGAAFAIVKTIENEIELGEQDKNKKMYLLEKLGGYLEGFNYAVIPGQNEAHDSSGWAQSAGRYLSAFEMKFTN
jgi:hypothetical protein